LNSSVTPVDHCVQKYEHVLLLQNHFVEYFIQVAVIFVGYFTNNTSHDKSLISTISATVNDNTCCNCSSVNPSAHVPNKNSANSLFVVILFSAFVHDIEID
jgi:hypothetical protein